MGPEDQGATGCVRLLRGHESGDGTHVHGGLTQHGKRDTAEGRDLLPDTREGALRAAVIGAQFEQDGAGVRFRWQPLAGDSGQSVTFCATDTDGERVRKTIRIAVVDERIDLDGDNDLDLVDHR